MNTICIMCPMGCPLTVTEENGTVRVEGNTCKRGETYGAKEYSRPERIVTTILAGGDAVYSVKTASPIPKDRIFDVVAEVKSCVPTRKYAIGETLLQNVCGTDADIVVTGVSIR